MKIEIKNCCKTYNKNIKVLNNINYTFTDGNFYVIMGESGAGKSTFINIIAGLLKCDSGNIFFDSKTPKDDREYAKLRETKIGLVYQSFLLNEDMNALDNVMLPLYLNKKITEKEREKQAISILERLGLGARIKHFPKELSGGEQQRVAIARAFINNPQIILADEPTGNLDKKNEKYIFELLKSVAESGKCVIVVSHNEKIKKYANKILYLENGTLYER